MQVNWLIVDAGKDQEVQALVNAATAAGSPAATIPIKDAYEGDSLPFKHDTLTVTHGPVSAIRHLNNRWRYYPGAWLPLDQLRCSHYLPYLGRLSVHRDWCLLPFGTLIEVGMAEHVYKGMFGRSPFDDELVLRPDTNDKIFDGERVSLSEFDHWKKQLVGNVPPEQLILISVPSVLAAEYRVIMRREMPVTASTYRVEHKIKHEPANEPELFKFCQQVGSSLQAMPGLPPVYTLDVAAVVGVGPRVLEIGSVNCCGFYACDLKQVVAAVNAEAEEHYKELFQPL